MDNFFLKFFIIIIIIIKVFFFCEPLGPFNLKVRFKYKVGINCQGSKYSLLNH